jgi:hypothetical protein
VLQAVGDGTGVKPIYDSLIEVKDLPYLDPDPEPLMRHITAAEAAGRPPVTFQRVERVAVLLSVLQSRQHNGFPVTATGADGEPYILGVVLRSQLLVLLQTKRCFQPSPFVSEVRGPLPGGLVDWGQSKGDCMWGWAGVGGGAGKEEGKRKVHAPVQWLAMVWILCVGRMGVWPGD